MKKLLFVCVVVWALIFSNYAFSAQFDFSGEWNYTTSNSWGPHNKDTSGMCSIVQKGDSFSFVFKTGYRCKPKPVCSLSGAVSGNTYYCSTKDQVDDEGGIVETKMRFSATSKSRASGKFTSVYHHPSGFTIKWGGDICIFR